MFAFTDMKDLNMLRDDSFLEKKKKKKKKRVSWTYIVLELKRYI